jgi:hypothetical protein
MDLLDEELLKLFRSMHQHGVKYLLVGGFATNLHGFSRITADLDLWIKDEKQNRIKFRDSLKDAEIGDFEAIENMEFIPGWTSICLDSGFELDIMCYISGFESGRFDECYEMASEAVITDIPVRFLNLQHLISSKKISDRDKDKIDVIELERIWRKKQN